MVGKLKKILQRKDFQIVTLFVLFDLLLTDIGITLGYGKEGNLLAAIFTHSLGLMLLEIIISILILLFLFSILKGVLRRAYASFQIGASMIGIVSWITQILIEIPEKFGPELATLFVIWSSIGMIASIFAFIYFGKNNYSAKY